MAAPLAAYIQNPLDSGNIGKKLHTQSEVVGTDTVHAINVIRRSRRKLLGLYTFASATQTVQVTGHDGVTTAFFWLENPVGATTNARLRRLQLTFNAGATEADRLTFPRIGLYRMTFTGTASGATLAVAKRRSDDAAAVAAIRTAVTGMTVTVGNEVWLTMVPVLSLTTAGQMWGGGPVARFNAQDDEEDYIVLAAGEGVILAQVDAGTASESRRFIATGLFDEYDAA